MGKKKRKQKQRKSRNQRKKELGEGVDFRYRTYFVGGKQKRFREELSDGIPVEKAIHENADEVVYQQNEMWECIDPPCEEPLTASAVAEPSEDWQIRNPGVDIGSPPAAKIALFRSLFRGREDVFAKRFESGKTGKCGYTPACADEWECKECGKPRHQCRNLDHRTFLQIDDSVVRMHLTGSDERGHPFVMGVYPILLDETCWFLAIDFDKADWQRDAAAFLETCQSREIPAALERSRSGNGGHVWFFFKEPVSCRMARQFGSFLLTETMRRRPDIGLDSYDRLFPNQNTMPRGGFGNLIALPLQKSAREDGNSVFLDDAFRPYSDQWKFLARIERISPERVIEWVERAERMRSVVGVSCFFDEDEEAFSLEPWAAPSRRKDVLPQVPAGSVDVVQVTLADGIYLKKEQLFPSLYNAVMRLAAFQNPEFHRAQAMRLSTWNKPRVIGCAEELEKFVKLPRGCLASLQELLDRLGIELEMKEERFSGEPLQVTFEGELRSDQKEAAEALIAHQTGVLAATTAFGKTVVAAWMIAERGVNTLVLVHRQQLMDQWVERLTEFLNISKKEIGRLGGGRKKLRGKIDIAMLQSVVRKGEVDPRVADYGQVVVDECHHVSARSFELAVSRAKAKYVLGLSATVVRKDGHHPIVFMQCGPVRHRVGALHQAKKSGIARTVIVRPTPFGTFVETDEVGMPYVQLCEQLVEHRDRNEMICADIAEAVCEGRSPLVLTEWTSHLDTLVGILNRLGVPTYSLRGGMKKGELRETLAGIAKDTGKEHRAIVATGKFVGEGFDEARLDMLFLAMPVSWKGTVAQYAGRLHRSHSEKSEIRILDYADLEVPMFARMFEKRRLGYESLGYTVTVPGSALPGWPSNVPLPADDAWKHRHAESARRLVRDGVDAQLANLFSEATFTDATTGPKAISEGATGSERARSASEAFLHRRLETLPGTSGRFQLNQSLPIPFGQSSEMEVDFLDREAKLVIELDGDQHLGDARAYRRDRHKDVQLQQHGYLVLRFLAADLGERLGHVLDTITRVLAERMR